MNIHLHLILVPLLISCLVSSCERHAEPTAMDTSSIDHDSPIKWITATKSLDRHAAETPGEPIVAIFTMKWDLVGMLFKKHIEAKENTSKRKSITSREPPRRTHPTAPRLGIHPKESLRLDTQPDSGYQRSTARILASQSLERHIHHASSQRASPHQHLRINTVQHHMKTFAIASVVALGGLVFANQENERVAEAENRPSPLIGHWATILTMGLPGPALITTITIHPDGTYHRLDIEMDPGMTDREDPASYLPDGADVQHSSGWIDLETGKERLPDPGQIVAIESITWSVKEGELHWEMDMGNMGGQGLIYSRVR